MYIHYPGNSLGLRWTIYRGLSRITEDFESATLTCVLYSKDNKFPVEATVMSAADGGSYLYIELSPELQLPDGIYGVSAIWKKNEDRSIARSMREGLFSVVNNQEEATDQGGAANIPVLKFHSSAGTFGYDGLSAYEMALLKGLTTKSETEWVQEQLDVATDQIFDAKDDAVGQAEAAITAAKDVAVSQAEDAVETAKDAAVSAANTAIGESKEDALEAIAEAIEGLEVHYDIESDKGTVKDVQLKDGQGNKLMPRIDAESVAELVKIDNNVNSIITNLVSNDYYTIDNSEESSLNGYTIDSENGNIIQSSVTGAKIRYIPVSKGQLVETNITSQGSGRFTHGFFDSIAEGQSSFMFVNIPNAEVVTGAVVMIAPKDCFYGVYSINSYSLGKYISKLTDKTKISDFQYSFKIIYGSGIKYDDGTEHIIPSGSRDCTDFIDIHGFSFLSYTRHLTTSSSNAYGLAFYDATKTYIPNSGVPGGVDAKETGYAIEEVEVPANAYYVRFTFWHYPSSGRFWYYNGHADAVVNKFHELGYSIENLSKRIPITSEYFNLSYSSNVPIRANMYMPYNGGCTIIVTRKTETDYSYAITCVTVSSEHTEEVTELTGGYTDKSNKYIITGEYDYIRIIARKGTETIVEVSIDDLLDAYDITFIYDNYPASIIDSSKERRWDFIGAWHQSSWKILLSDYLAIPKQFMTLRMDIPKWARVRFHYGLREYAGWTGYYYSGDVVTFTREQSALQAELTFIDNRGVSINTYENNAAGNEMSFTILEEKDDDIFHRNFDAEKYLGVIRSTPGYKQKDLPVLIHVSDIHGDSTRFNSAYDYADYLGARLVVDTGDNPFFRLNQQILFHEKVVFSHKTDFVNCIGNHDTYGSANEAFSKNIAPFAETYSYHKSNSSDITDKCYFYKDLADCNLRIIAMNIYDGIVSAAYKARISSAQFNWFIATLSSTPSGYGVIVILHQAPHFISAISGKTDFNDSTMDPQIGSIDSDYMSAGKITGNPFGKVIDAFIGKTTVSGSYTQKNAAFTDDETISYEADFSNVTEGVEFIAYLNGHTHRDHIGYVSDCVHNQLNMNVCSVSPISQSTGYKTDSDIMRDSNGSNQDAFNVYTIDRVNKRVGIARIGSNLTNDLRDRKVMWVSYV